jgi:hypothetical protein
MGAETAVTIVSRFRACSAGETRKTRMANPYAQASASTCSVLPKKNKTPYLRARNGPAGTAT